MEKQIKPKTVSVMKHASGHLQRLNVTRKILLARLGEFNFGQAMTSLAEGAVLHWHPKYQTLAALSRRGYQVWPLK